MADHIVRDYLAQWNTKENKGRIAIKLDESEDPLPIDVNSSGEFLAVLTLLQGKPPVHWRDGVLSADS